jgi:hypothetical protein
MLHWILLGVGLSVAAAIGFWWLRSLDTEIRRGLERARRRHFHETGGGWTKLPWEAGAKEPDRKDKRIR